MPLYRDPKSGDVVTQYDMRCVEKVGLIKFDFLGLKTLTVIADAERADPRERPSRTSRSSGSRSTTRKTYDLLCARRHRGRVPGRVVRA